MASKKWSLVSEHGEMELLKPVVSSAPGDPLSETRGGLSRSNVVDLVAYCSLVRGASVPAPADVVINDSV